MHNFDFLNYVPAGKFFWYLLFVILNLTFFTFYGMLAVSITPNAQMAAVVSTSTYGLWFLCAPIPALQQFKSMSTC